MKRRMDCQEAVRMIETEDWRAWMRNLGQRMRRLRVVTGLTQEALAVAAGVSQGSVSRFEAGHGLATPLLVTVKINGVIARALQRINADMLSEEARQYLDRMSYLFVPRFSGVPSHVFGDARMDETLHLLANLTPERRGVALDVIRGVAHAFVQHAPVEASP